MMDWLSGLVFGAAWLPVQRGSGARFRFQAAESWFDASCPPRPLNSCCDSENLRYNWLFAKGMFQNSF